MNRIQRLQAWMKKENLDGFISCDAVTRRYLTGFSASAGWIAVDADDAVFFCDSRYELAASQQADGYQVCLAKQGFYRELVDWAKERRLMRIGVEAQRLNLAVFLELKRCLGADCLVVTEDPVTQLRMIKDEKELQILERAARISDDAWTFLLGEIRPGRSERELAWCLECRMRELGADGIAFDTILASGENGACPHAQVSERKIQNGDLVTVDFGCVVDGYCSDMTRTVAVGFLSEEQKFWYESVLKVQQACVEAVRPGISSCAVDELSRRMLCEVGLDSYFGHALGHGLGLEIHEQPTLSPKSECTLLPGMVVTVEPGVYLPQKGGLRIEDTVVVTADGCRRLTQSSKVLTIL